MKPVIFSGPSLDVRQAAKLLDAVYLPPAGHGDLLGALENLSPTAIGLVDGVCNGQTVWYKEIMLALDQGVPVYGASHLGAIRAVELGPCGMQGVGRIYDLLKKQDFLDYGETATTWKQAGDAYIRTSEPMANIRATLTSALQDGILQKDVCVWMQETAASIFYQDRTWEGIIKTCGHHLSAQLSKAFRSWLAHGYVDQQALDALELVECLRNPILPVQKAGASCWKTSVIARSIQERYTTVQRLNGPVMRSEIVDHAALHHPDFPEINFNALNRKLVMLFAEGLGIESDPALEIIEEERFRRRKKLQDDHDFAQWLQDNDLNAVAFREMMAERAVCHRLHRWLMQVKQPSSKNTKAVLEELKLRGDFPEMADKAAAMAKLIRQEFDNPDQTKTPDVTKAFRGHLRHTRIPWEYDYKVVIQEYGLSFAAFYWELHKSRLAREYVGELVKGKDRDPQ